MPQCLIVARITLDWEDVQTVREYTADMARALSGVAGFQGSGTWKGVRNPHARLVLFSYETPDAAKRGLVEIADLPSLAERQSAGAEPADVKVLLVEDTDGRFADAVPTDLCLSFSIRVAEPGYGEEMLDEYRNVFAGLAMLPGYAGGLIGVNANLADEVAGLVAWRSEVAFAASMPENALYEVRLYEPAGEV